MKPRSLYHAMPEAGLTINVGIFTFSFSAHCLIMSYICTKFLGNYFYGFHTKWLNSVNVGGVTVFQFCTLFYHSLYINQVSWKYLKEF